MLPAVRPLFLFLFFFNDTATTEIYTLSLHDALPISPTGLEDILARWGVDANPDVVQDAEHGTSKIVSNFGSHPAVRDRKSTRLNSSHQIISYAVFCLKKKKRILMCYACGDQ